MQQNFPLLLKKKRGGKNFERGLMFGARLSPKGAPRLQEHHPHFPVLLLQQYPSRLKQFREKTSEGFLQALTFLSSGCPT